MLPFRSGDPEPGGGSQHLGLDSVEFHPVINCLLSAFPHTAVNRLALKIYNPRVYVQHLHLGRPLSPSESDLMLFHEGTLPASLGYHLPCVAISGGLQADLRHEPLRSTPVTGSWPDVFVSLICLAAKPFRVQESWQQCFRLRPNTHYVANCCTSSAFWRLQVLDTEQSRLWTKC